MPYMPANLIIAQHLSDCPGLSLGALAADERPPTRSSRAPMGRQPVRGFPWVEGTRGSGTPQQSWWAAVP